MEENAQNEGQVFPDEPTTPTPERPTTTEPIICHGVPWEDDEVKTLKTQNGVIHRRLWSVQTATGHILSPYCELGRTMSRLDYFLLMFPPKQLSEMVRLTNLELEKLNVQLTTKGEIIKYIGVMILSTHFEFG